MKIFWGILKDEVITWKKVLAVVIYAIYKFSTRTIVMTYIPYLIVTNINRMDAWFVAMPGRGYIVIFLIHLVMTFFILPGNVMRVIMIAHFTAQSHGIVATVAITLIFQLIIQTIGDILVGLAFRLLIRKCGWLKGF